MLKQVEAGEDEGGGGGEVVGEHPPTLDRWVDVNMGNNKWLLDFTNLQLKRSHGGG